MMNKSSFHYIRSMRRAKFLDLFRVFILGVMAMYAMTSVHAQESSFDSLVNDYNASTDKRIKFDLAAKLLASHQQTKATYLKWFKTALSLAEELDNDTLRVRANFLEARRLMYNGSDAKGLKQMINALRLSEEMVDSANMASIHYTIGAYYFWKKDQRLAEEYFEKSLTNYPKIGQQSGRATPLMALGIINQDKGNYEVALNYHLKAIEIKKRSQAWLELPTSYSNLFELYDMMGDTINAMSSLQRSIELSDSLNSEQSKAYSSFLMGKFLLGQSKVETAITNLKYAITWWEERNSRKELPRGYEQLAKAYGKAGEYEKSIAVYQKLIAIQDTLFNAAKMTAVQDVETKYETEKKEIEIEKQKKEKEWAKKETELVKGQEKTQRTIFIIVAILLIINAIYFFTRYKKQKRDKQLIEAQKIQIEARSQEIEDSINYAKRIQTAVLPSDSRIKSYDLDCFIMYLPKDIVAGDFYWFEQKENQLLFAAADCTGHGVPGAMVSMICNNAMNRSVREFGLTHPGEILDKTREIVIQEFEKSEEEVKDGMDVSLCSMSQLPSGKTSLHYAGAHNPLWVIRQGAQEVEETKADKQPIGKSDIKNKFTTHFLELNAGDTFYLFTDGFADQFGGTGRAGRGKKYKTANFKRLLVSIQNETMRVQNQMIKSAFQDWKGELEQLDDVCVIGVRV